jgi:hypothetical protein
MLTDHLYVAGIGIRINISKYVFDII